MKRFLLCIFCLFFLVGCSTDNQDWSSIYIDNCGTIEVPNDEWKLVYQNDILTIQNTYNEIIMSEQPINDCEFDLLRSEGVSTGAVFAEHSPLNDCDEENMLSLSLPNSGDFSYTIFWVYSSEIDYELLGEIAKTFQPNMEDRREDRGQFYD